MNEVQNGLWLSGVTKRFGATQALGNAQLHVATGQIHTLLGENGSGKSTMVKIIGGVQRADTGTLTLNGHPLNFNNPRQANDAGIATVFQEVLTAPSQSVLDNIWLGSDGIFKKNLSAAERRRIASETLEKLVDGVDLTAPAGAFPLSIRQAIGIARALVRNPRVLILDESTAALDVLTRDRLFAEMRRLKSQGASILFISHRMDEVAEISDQVTVLRNGRTISSVSRENISIDKLIADMTGTKQLHQRANSGRSLGDATLEAQNIVLKPTSEPINFTLRAGEMVGVAGLEGHGQDAFLKRLAGLTSGTGTVTRLVSPAIPVHSSNGGKLGIAYLPRERRGESLFESMSIRENFALPTLSLDRKGLLLSVKFMRDRFGEFISSMSIRLGRQTDPISSLSGGNQQKVLLARWLATDPKVLLLNDPTRGVDIKTKREIYAILDRLCADGMSVVILSSEVDELVELVDRALVFRDQEVFAELPKSALTTENVVAAYFGQSIGANK